MSSPGFWHFDLPEIGYVDSGNLDGACVTAPAVWEVAETESVRVCAYCLTAQPDTVPAERGPICGGCLFHLGGDVVAEVDHFETEADYHAARDQMPEEVAETGSEPRRPEIDRELDASVLPYGVISDFLIAELISRAPGPGSVRPWAFWWGVVGLSPGGPGRISDLLSGSVGPFPVEPLVETRGPEDCRGFEQHPETGMVRACSLLAGHASRHQHLPPGLSAAQRRLVGEGWVHLPQEQQHALGDVRMLSPDGVYMWVSPGGRKHFGKPSELLAHHLPPWDDGVAARQTREARAERCEDVDGRVQGVDRG